MPPSRSVCICTIHGRPIRGHEAHPALPQGDVGLRSPPVSFEQLRPWPTVSSCIVRAAPTLSPTRALTGPVVQILAALRLATQCFWGITWSPGRPRGRPSSPVPVQRLSIAPLPTAWLRPLGFVSCSMSFKLRRRGAHLSTVTISAPCIYQPTPFSINALSMWGLISISSERR
jgi:hypothetical protein